MAKKTIAKKYVAVMHKPTKKWLQSFPEVGTDLVDNVLEATIMEASLLNLEDWLEMDSETNEGVELNVDECQAYEVTAVVGNAV